MASSSLAVFAARSLRSDLDLGLVARLAHPRRHDGGAVVCREVMIAAVYPGLVATGRCHTRLEVVADQLARHAAEEGPCV